MKANLQFPKPRLNQFKVECVDADFPARPEIVSEIVKAIKFALIESKQQLSAP